MKVYEKSYNACVPNYTHIYFPYSTVTSARQCSGLACTRTVFRTLTYMQTRFRHQNKAFCIGIGMNKYSRSIATQLFYQRTPFDTAIYEKFMWFNHKTKYTDWCPIPNDGGWGICLRKWKPVKDFEQCSRVYNAVRYNSFSRGLDDRIIMELQCNIYKLLCIRSPDHHLKFASCVPLCQVLKVCIPDYD